MTAGARGVLVVGNACHDTLVSEGGTHETLGGAVAYACAVLDGLSVPYRAVCKVGPDFLYRAELQARPRVVPSSRTTRFLDTYAGGARRERVLERCEPILPEDLAGEGRVRVAIAAAVAGEVPPATLRALRGRCDVLLADAQGLLRSFGPAGEVGLEPLDRTGFADLAGQIDYLKVGEAEAPFVDVDALRTRTTLLLTRGPRGCRVVGPGMDLEVDGFPADERDPTGAGDAFLAGFAAGLVQDLTEAKAALLGTFCGARAVEHLGVPRFGRGQLSRARERLQRGVRGNS